MNRLSGRWAALIILTGTNLFNSIDRYVFSALAPQMQRDLGITDTELGWLGSAFILAYVALVPAFGRGGARVPRPKVMAAAAALGSVATALSGVARTFAGQLFARIAVGLGKSVDSVIAPSSIVDLFPKSTRGRVLAIYSGVLPAVGALGYILGEQLQRAFGWEKAFFLVGATGAVGAALLFLLPGPPRQEPGARAASARPPVETLEPVRGPAGAPRPDFFSSCGTLFRSGGFNVVVLGATAYTFVVGGMAFWMPAYIDRYFGIENGITIFGAVTVAGGLAGTSLGGRWADRIERESGNGFLKIGIWSMALAAPLFAVMLTIADFRGFMVALFFMEAALFLCLGPLNAAVVAYAKPSLRAAATGTNVFLIHVFGDGVSRVLIGSISDQAGLKAALALCPWVLALAGLIWTAGLVFFWRPLKWPARGARLPSLIAHRGYWKPTGLQENTLEAFRAAKIRGIRMVELDVMLSGDGRAVVFHDADLRRLGRRDERVAGTPAENLRAWVNAPLLEEVLTDPEVADFINIELKTGRVFDGRLEREVARVVRSARAEERVEFSSFNPFALRRIAGLLPEAPRALLVSEAPDPHNKIYLRKMWFGFYCRPHLLHLDEAMLTPARLEDWRARGLTIAAWTVNDEGRARELRAWGVHSLISDELLP